MGKNIYEAARPAASDPQNNPFRSLEAPPSELAYFHDQKGKYHDPQHMTVVGFKADSQVLQGTREEYLEGRKDVSEEMKRLSNLLDIIKNDPKALSFLKDLLENCLAYFESILKLARTKIKHKESETRIYQMEVKAADSLRTSKHTVLISDLARLRRYVMQKYGPDGEIESHDEKELPSTVLFTGTFTTSGDAKMDARRRRKAIGLWALRMAEAIEKMSDEDLKLIGFKLAA